MLWKKKNKEIKSDEFEELNKKIVSIVRDIDIMSNNLSLLDSIVKSNRARINKVKLDKIEAEAEKDLNDDGVVYLGENRVK